MKKILLLMAIILPFVLTSCGDEKDEPQSLEQQLIGDWYYLLNEYTVQNYLFNSDHTGKYWVKQDGEVINGSIVTFNWSLEKINNETILVIESEGFPTAYYSIFIKDDELHLDSNLPGLSWIYKRVQ